MRYDRDDDMVITGKRHDFRIDYEVGFDDEGRILAVDVTHYARCGWSQDLSLAVADRAMLHRDNAYLVPHMRITSHRLKTNMQSATAFRGFGGPQGMLGMERIVEHVARHLGRDPVEVRRLNFYAPKDGAKGGPGTGPRIGGTHAPQVGTPGQRHALRHGGHGLRPARDDRGAAPVLGLRAAARGHRGVERGEPASQEGHRLFAGEVRHLLHADASQSGGRAGARLPGRLGHGEPWRDRDGPGSPPQDHAGGGVAVRGAAGAGADHGDGYGAGAEHLGDGGVVGCGPERDGDAGGLRRDPRSDGRASGGAAPDHAGPGRVPGRDGRGRGQPMAWDAAVESCYLARVSLSSTGFYATPDLEWDRLRGKGRPFFYFAYGRR
jgi:xanthine dehydrogenase large subunit